MGGYHHPPKRLRITRDRLVLALVPKNSVITIQKTQKLGEKCVTNLGTPQGPLKCDVLLKKCCVSNCLLLQQLLLPPIPPFRNNRPLMTIPPPSKATLTPPPPPSFPCHCRSNLSHVPHLTSRITLLLTHLTSRITRLTHRTSRASHVTRHMNGLVDLVCRPPRAEYDTTHLGPQYAIAFFWQ